MSAIQIHVAITHISVIGIPLIALLLLWGLVRRSEDIQRASLGAWILLGLFLLVLSQTGESAEELLEKAAGVGEFIHPHEEAAEGATTGGIVLAVFCALQLAYWKWKQRPLYAALWVTLIGAVFLSVVLARVAHLGGLIEHLSLRG